MKKGLAYKMAQPTLKRQKMCTTKMKTGLCTESQPCINGIRIVPRNCYFRKGQAVPSPSLPQHFRDPMALPWRSSVLHKWHQDGPPALLFSKGAEARVAFSISTFLRPNGIALTTSALLGPFPYN